MIARLMMTTAVLACCALATSAQAEGEGLLLTDLPSGMLASDAPLGTSDYVDPLADDYFAEIAANRSSGLSGTELQSNAAVPEPSTLVLLGLGGLLITRRRQR